MEDSVVAVQASPSLSYEARVSGGSFCELWR